jgi:hypothetical protein
LARPSKGGWLHQSPSRRRGSHASRSSRILNSLQTIMIFRSVVIMLTESGGASKQFLTPPPILKLGILPFPYCRCTLGSSIDGRLSAHIPSRTSHPSSTCGPGILGSFSISPGYTENRDWDASDSQPTRYLPPEPTTEGIQITLSEICALHPRT